MARSPTRSRALGTLGLSTGFIGKVSDDALGRFYAQAMAEVGTDFVNAPRPDGAGCPPRAR